MVLAIGFAVAAGLVGLAVLGVVASGPPPDRTKDHTTELSTGESRILAAQLVEVPGYTYQDVSEDESKRIRNNLREWAQAVGVPEDIFSAVSLHAVKADDSSQNTALGSLGLEVGFLSLSEFSEAPPAGAIGQLGAGYQDSIDEFEVDGVTVRVFETPDSADSRFTYWWFRHGVQGMLDGATREETQRWVTDYLSQPVRVGAESGLLGAALSRSPAMTTQTSISAVMT